MKIIVFIFLLLFSVTSLNAENQKEFRSKCMRCHGHVTKLASIHTKDEWDNVFNNNLESFVKNHKETRIKQYFNSQRFINKKSELQDSLKGWSDYATWGH